MSESVTLPTMDVEATAATPAASAPTKAVELGVVSAMLRTPRAAVLVDGKQVPDAALIEAKWNVNGFQSADTFGVVITLDDRPDSFFPSNYFSDNETIEIEVRVGVKGKPAKSMIVGLVDDVEMDYARREIRLNGRDRTGLFIEAKTTERWANLTSSEIATQLATRRGLTPVVTATTTRAGTYYQGNHDRLTNETTEWNLLTYLAEQEGFIVYVQGRELHFEPPVPEGEAPRWSLTYGAPTLASPIPRLSTFGLSLRRNLTVARDIEVEVISWNSGQARAIRAIARAERTGRTSQGRPGTRLPTQRFVIRRPGLTQEQALQHAQQKLSEFSRHERTVDADRLPGDERLTARHLLVLSGTKTSFDQTYRLDSIISSIGPDGYTMRLRARNLAPTSTVSL